jgi:hypothetical protein
MHEFQDWTFSARGRTVTARVQVDGHGGGTVTRFETRPGPSQSGLSIKVGSQQEAAAELERILTGLLGADW